MLPNSNDRKFFYMFAIAVAILLGTLSGTHLFETVTNAVTPTSYKDTIVDLPAGKKLIPSTIHWDSETQTTGLWYLVEDAEEGYKPKTYEFYEINNKGSVIFIEH